LLPSASIPNRADLVNLCLIGRTLTADLPAVLVFFFDLLAIIFSFDESYEYKRHINAVSGPIVNRNRRVVILSLLAKPRIAAGCVINILA
jgi:hypothetical protein